MAPERCGVTHLDVCDTGLWVVLDVILHLET